MNALHRPCGRLPVLVVLLGMVLAAILPGMGLTSSGRTASAAQTFPTTIALTGTVTSYTPATPSVSGWITVRGVTVELDPGSVFPPYVRVGGCIYIVYIPGNPNELVEISPAFRCPSQVPVPTTPPAPVVVPGVPIVSLTVIKLVRDVTRRGAFGQSGYAVPGDTIEYQITVGNNGSATAQNVQISDPIEPYQSDAGRVITCAVGTLAPGQTQIASFREVIAASAVNGQQIYNTATARAVNANPVISTTAIEVSAQALRAALRSFTQERRATVPTGRSTPSDPPCTVR